MIKIDKANNEQINNMHITFGLFPYILNDFCPFDDTFNNGFMLCCK